MSDDCKRLTAADGGGGGGDGQWQVHPAAPVPAGGGLRCRGRQDDLCDGASEDRGDQPGGQGGAGEERGVQAYVWGNTGYQYASSCTNGEWRRS